MMRVIDIETTGMDPAKDRVVEIASVDVSKAGIANSRRTFVNPGIPIPPESSAVHHILDEDVKGAPDFETAIKPFEVDASSWFIAHNAAFEQKFLADYLGHNWICTYRCALRVWPEAPAHNNQTLRYMLGLTNPFGMARKDINPHRALDDCIVTAGIFLEIAKLAKWPDIVRWSQEPPLQHVCRIGDHRGKKWSEVPIDFIQWALKKITDDAEIQFTCEYWLNQRKLKGAA